MNYIRKYASPAGMLTLASDGESLTGLWIEGQDYFPDLDKTVNQKDDLPVFVQTIQWLNKYFEGTNPGALPPVAPEGTGFRKAVWDVLVKIPYGTLKTYGDVAREVSGNQNGKFVSPRAVGGAVGHNPISIIIPCHRVIGSNNSLTGYAGGLDLKVKLLESEKINVSKYKR